MSFDFTTLVTDRTQSDVQRVRSVAAKIINGTASAAEIAEWNAANMKGAYNYTDLNRVTAAMEALKAKLEGYGYAVPGYQRISVPHVLPEPEPTSKLPEGYLELTYIESTGTQYIDTGVFLSNNSKVVADCEITYSTGWAMLLGSYGSSDRFSWWTNGAKISPYYGATGKNADGVTGRTTLIADKNTWSDGVSEFSFPETSFVAAHSMYLFSVNNGGNYPNAPLKLYSCQVYDNGTLIRDFVPCVNSAGVAGLYDMVNGVFYQNAGTGTFATGNVIPRPSQPIVIDPYTWYETDIPTPELMAAHLANVSAIRSVLDMLPTTPAVPADMEQLTTDKANAIERILADINTLIHNMIAAWFYSGEIYSGEV